MKSMVKVPKSLRPALDFRRSVTKDKISTPIAIPAKSAPSILPPKKVIRALYDYEAKAPNELSFSKGDFFHVVDKDNDQNWYEACNPATNMRGMVPVAYFQVLEKSSRLNDEKAESDTFSNAYFGGNKPQPLYGTVLYDFIAERPDELDAKAGEPIIVIAQSNHEWFVAKPIGRLGGPGLIPVSFIEIKDHATGKIIDNVQELMDKSIVPKVEEWKKMTQDYQENSIALGRLDFTVDSKLAPVGMDPKLAPVSLDYDPKLAPISLDFESRLAPISFESDLGLSELIQTGNNDYMPENIGNVDRNSDASNTLPMSPVEQLEYDDDPDADANDEEIIAVSVESFHFEDDQYMFLLRAELASGCFRLLYRLYEDFYKFQVTLLEKFPVEAGRAGEPRVLPYMPGPLSYVNDMITAQRRSDLDVYVKELLNLPPHIVQDPLLQQLFGIRDGDVETPTDPRQPAGANGSIIDPSHIDPLPTYPSSHLQNLPRRQSSLKGLNNKHTTNLSSSSGQSFTKPSRIQEESSSNKPISPKNTTPAPTASNLSFLKIKISYQDEKYIIRVPSDVNYTQLREKIYDRLGGHVSSLTYKDETTNEIFSLEDDEDLVHALESNPKLFLYAE